MIQNSFILDEQRDSKRPTVVSDSQIGESTTTSSHRHARPSLIDLLAGELGAPRDNILGSNNADISLSTQNQQHHRGS